MAECPKCRAQVDVVVDTAGDHHTLNQESVAEGERYIVVDYGVRPWVAERVSNPLESGQPEHGDLCPFR